MLASCASLPAPTPAADSAAAALPAHAEPARSGLPPFETLLAQTDLSPDTAMRFGRLPNGLTYVIRHNETPQGTAEVRLRFDAGSLDETDQELGYAHFVEHMAFNGSTHVPEGEMVALLERKGLAFGADTNASTGFDATTYKLSLPTNEGELLDTALMLMRETASELSFTPGAVDREKGVVLSELRDGNTYAFADTVDRIAFESPDATYPHRLPIGTAESIQGATSESLRGFWSRNYRPEHAVLSVVGDFPPELVEQAIRARFADWQGATSEQPPREYGRVDPDRKPAEDIYTNPALSERVTASREGEPQLTHDTRATRREDLLRWLGYAIVNRRLKRLARLEDPPFKSAGFGSGEVFRIGRMTRLIIDTPDGGWQRGLAAAVAEYRRALAGGFSQAEVDEQMARVITFYEDSAAGEATRNNHELTRDILQMFDDGEIPILPSAGLADLKANADTITPDAVLAAMSEEAVPLDKAMLRYSGRSEPEGGAEALRAAWNAAMTAPLAKTAPPETAEFGYTDFGPPGTVVSDTREPVYGIREVRFANNVRLNVKHTDLEEDRVSVRLSLDGGQLLQTKDNPLAVELVPSLSAGGLGKHSADELETILAGRSVGVSFKASGDVFTSTRTTTPRDLELQLDLLAAFITDPGWRPEAVTKYRSGLPDRFARMKATPRAAISTHQYEILSDEDPRFTTQPIEAYEALDFAKLRAAIGDRLAHGAIEIGVVGAIDEDAVIALVAKTLGALPRRDADFAERPDARMRSFTARRGPVYLRHDGADNQALIRYVFPTTDDSDPELTAQLELLEKVAQIKLIEELRERLGQAYSPGAASSMSRTYTKFGLFILNVGVDLSQVPASVAAIDTALASLRNGLLSEDTLQRARQPLLDRYDNALKSNSGWLGLVDRAQSEADRLARFSAYRGRLQAITPHDIQQSARIWLPEGGAVEMIVIPEGVKEPVLANSGK